MAEKLEPPRIRTDHEVHDAGEHRFFSLPWSIVTKCENLFMVARRDGSVPIGRGSHPLGIYLNDCRFISGLELRLCANELDLLVASDHFGTAAVHELTNGETTMPDGSTLTPQTVQVRIDRGLVDGNTMAERIMVQSFNQVPLALRLEIAFEADFEPMLAIRGMVTGLPPIEVTCEPSDGGIAFRSVGRDDIPRQVTITACENTPLVNDDTLMFDLELDARGREVIELRYNLTEGEPPIRNTPIRIGEMIEHAATQWPTETRVETDDQLFDRVLQRSLLDLDLLRSHYRGKSYHAAGIPWFTTLFGRDSLITAMEMLVFDPDMAADVLRLHAELMGRGTDHRHAEQPGRIVHEVRFGEIAHTDLSPFSRYYGSADATPLFLCLLCDYIDWSGDIDIFDELRDAVEAALVWIDDFGDLDGDGMIEYPAAPGDALRNQGWKDSDDGVCDGEGRPLDGPIALIEVQGYVIRAKRRLARLFERRDEVERANALRVEAAELRGKMHDFWLRERGFFAIATDGRKAPSAALASNQGHLLWALGVDRRMATSIRDAIMHRDMFSGWGIRTLAQKEPGYNPVGYHTGSVWPHDNAIIAAGLRKYGFDDDFTRVFEGVLEAASRFPNYRLPELFAGFSRTEYDDPVPYPVACHPQAWAAGAIPYMLTAGLGLVPEGCDRRLRIVRPTLPRWVNQVDIYDLKLAGTRIDLHFVRTPDGHVTLSDSNIEGDVEVVHEINVNRTLPIDR